MLNDRSLVKDDPPPFRGLPPDGGAAGFPCLLLVERVGDQVEVGCELLAAEVFGLQVFDHRMLMAAFEFLKYELATVAAAGGTHLPEIFASHAFEVGPRSSKLRAVEDGLAASQLFENACQRGVGIAIRLHSFTLGAAGAARLERG